MTTDYKIEYLVVLLNEDCVLERYYPLIKKKEQLVSYLKSRKVTRKSDCTKISDTELGEILTSDEIRLFRRFLTIYDVKPEKLRELRLLDVSNDDKTAYQELYTLPGVKETRARLYFSVGIRSLREIATATPEEIIDKCKAIIEKSGLKIKPPLPKEVKTHVAVAKAFTDE